MVFRLLESQNERLLSVLGSLNSILLRRVNDREVVFIECVPHLVLFYRFLFIYFTHLSGFDRRFLIGEIKVIHLSNDFFTRRTIAFLCCN